MTIERCRRCRQAQTGFSLAEAVLAMVILSMAAAGVLLPAVSGATVQAEGLHRTLGAVLANDLVEQIVSMPFETIRDHRDDYEYTEQLQDASSTTFADSMYANFSRKVKCTWNEDQPFFLLVRVQVFYSGQEVASVYRLISQ